MNPCRCFYVSKRTDMGRWTKNIERDKKIIAERLSGATYLQCGIRHGVTEQTAHAICERAIKRGEIAAERARGRNPVGER